MIKSLPLWDIYLYTNWSNGTLTILIFHFCIDKSNLPVAQAMVIYLVDLRIDCLSS